MDLDLINQARRRQHRSPLTSSQAASAASSAPPDTNLNLFLIGLITSGAFDSPSDSPASQPDVSASFSYGDSGGGVDSGGG